MFKTFFKELIQSRNDILLLGNKGRGISKIIPPEGTVRFPEIKTDRGQIGVLPKND